MAPPDVGIYGIENTITGKWYIGSSVELSKRFNRHLWELKSGRHHSDKLQRSFDKHGELAFEFKLLLVCSKEDLEFYETRAIEVYKGYRGGYNVAAESKGGFMRGRSWPEATKAARIEEMKTRKISEKHKARISEVKLAEWADPAIHEARSASMRKPKSKEGAANIAAATLKRLRDPDPIQVEARRQNLLKGWETRRNNKRQRSL